MSDWIHGLPVGWMAAVIFGATYLGTAAIYLLVMALAVGDRGRAFKGVSPGMLPPLGILFGLLVAFVAAQVWGDLDRANAAVNREASALRAVVLLSEAFPGETENRLRGLITRHIREAHGRVAGHGPAASHPDHDPGSAGRSAERDGRPRREG